MSKGRKRKKMRSRPPNFKRAKRPATAPKLVRQSEATAPQSARPLRPEDVQAPRVNGSGWREEDTRQDFD